MGRFLVMCVVRFVGEGLRGGQTADDQHTENQEDCEGSSGADVAHHLPVNPV